MPGKAVTRVEDLGLPRSNDLQAWLSECYRHHADDLYRYAYRRIGSAAADVIAETFLVAVRRAKSFDPNRGTARAWLFGIASREIGRHRRTEVARIRAAARAASLEIEPVDDVIDGVAAAAAWAAISTALIKLRREDRDVLLLFAWADLTYDEIATALGIPIGTVRSRLSRARAKTRAALGDVDPTTIIED